eukprot:Opistho-2@6777
MAPLRVTVALVVAATALLLCNPSLGAVVVGGQDCSNGGQNCTSTIQCDSPLVYCLETRSCVNPNPCGNPANATCPEGQKFCSTLAKCINSNDTCDSVSCPSGTVWCVASSKCVNVTCANPPPSASMSQAPPS